MGTYNVTEIVDSILKKGPEGYVLNQSTATDLPEAVDKVLNEEKLISKLVVTEQNRQGEKST